MLSKPLRRATVGLLSLVAACTVSAGGDETSTLNVEFNPMFSGFDGVHTYQVPSTIGNADVTGITNVSWSASDPSMVDLQPQSDGISVMITTKKAGTVDITASTADGGVGKTTLTITAFTPDDWTTGQTRYNSGAVIMGGGGHGHGSGDGSDGSADMDKYVQCTSCHDPAVAAGMVGSASEGRTIEHTPEQTGGFTDDQMRGIFLDGELPKSDANPINMSPQRFMSFHTWQASDDEATGLLAFLRSLTPTSQGEFDYGGHGGGGSGGGGHGGGGGGGSGGGSDSGSGSGSD
ncbi:MAG TPA: hypothetical protein VH914_21560 [Acidimicrobiia bacterium]|jgi:hypothetical protein|nr:hypothetical protein [Acidimicrobiia bacterium]